MEGELASTIEAIDGVDTAVVHLALPPKQVFAEEQDPATASVLVDTRAGTTLGPDQVQAVVNLVASSIDGLDPAKVTVADSAGRVLSEGDESGSGMSSSRNRQVEDYQDQLSAKAQAMLDRVFGPGNSSVQVTAVLDFDKVTADHDVRQAQAGAGPRRVGRRARPTPAARAPRPPAASSAPTPSSRPAAPAATAATATPRRCARTASTRSSSRPRPRPGSVESLHAAVVVDTNSDVTVDATEINEPRLLRHRPRPRPRRHHRDLRRCRSTPPSPTPTRRR